MNYKSTLNLPHTEFPMKANLAQREPAMVERWKNDKIYEAMLAARKGGAPFILHDGPPYANGHIHFGHILNKVLKDIVVKSRAMAGYYTPFLPGWDCHGLPIELAVEKEMGGRDPNRSALEVRKACRTYAETYVGFQREEFRRLGCFGLWDTPYQTMDYGYQAEVARQFAAFVEKGAVYSGKRPIYWCASCRTALAETEVEYDNIRSPSIFVKFQLTDVDDLRGSWNVTKEPVYLVIWTTTPWTIPANLAIALHPQFEYVAVDVNGEIWIVAEGRLETMMQTIGISDYTVRGRVDPTSLEKRQARHPLVERSSLIVNGELVTLDAGSGCVHIAPGHGHDDFFLGKHYGLDPFGPIDDGGKFTDDVGLDWLVGLFVKKANPLIMEKLASNGALAYASTVEHQYPHCWRCKRAILFRVTEQWFISMAETKLREQATKAIDTVEWIPAWGRNRIYNMMEHRPDWCISRQRAWGVPIVAVRCGACGERGTSPEFVRLVADRIEKEGADCWYQHDLDTLMPKGFQCPHCAKAGPFTKEHDILDVWFDSGSSFAAALERQLGVPAPADLYLEGSDQHRGWFHTSLLVGLGTRGAPPYRSVFTHGFVVDGQGKKYSKSAKNYVPPEKVMNQYGAELMRLWVSAEDYTDDIRVSDEILKRLAEAYRKIRNTWRFILGNLFDFDPATDQVAYTDLTDLDQWILHEFNQTIAKCRAAYNNYEFHHVYHSVNAFCTVQLSARYLDICKDRLYCEDKTGQLRRGTQTVMLQIGNALTRLMAPVLSFTAEEVWDFFPGGAQEHGSVFTAQLPAADKAWENDAVADRWRTFWSLREVANKALEDARAAKAIGNSLGAALTIQCNDETKTFLESFGDALADYCLVSDVVFGTVSGDYIAKSETEADFATSVANAQGTKCGRCWKIKTSVGDSTDHPEICARCVGVVSS